MLRTELSKDLKLDSLIRRNENILPFAFENFAFLNAASRSQLRDKVVSITQIEDKNLVISHLPSVNHLNSFVQLYTKLGFGNSKEIINFFKN